MTTSSQLLIGEVCEVSDVSHRQRPCEFDYNVIAKGLLF